MNLDTSSATQTLQDLEKRLDYLEQEFQRRYCRELIHYESKLFLKDHNNTIYSICNPSTKIGIYINKRITFCSTDEELEEETYQK